MNHCIYCGTTEHELRPYGLNGAWVCFDCAMETPERQEELGRQFDLQMDAAIANSKSGTVVIGEVTGPYPVENNPDLSYLVEKKK